MPTKFDKLMADMADEINEEEKPAETQAAEDQPEEHPEEKPEDQPAAGPAEEPPAEEPPADDESQQDPVPPKPAPHDIPDDPVKRAEYSFRRQLGRQKEKHAAELKERDDKYDKLMKEFEELKKSLAPKEELKTRNDFTDDEDYINYLTKSKVDAMMKERDAADAKARAEREEQEAKRRADEEELARQQNEWLGNVNEAFHGDQERSSKFLQRVQFANRNGLGEILDNCPVASDYLLHNPMGPVVFEKMLNDRETFTRVFNERRTSPLDVYYELRRVEDEIQRASAQEQEPPPAAVPHIGKPGKQAASGGASGDMFDNPAALKKWMREH